MLVIDDQPMELAGIWLEPGRRLNGRLRRHRCVETLHAWLDERLRVWQVRPPPRRRRRRDPPRPADSGRPPRKVSCLGDGERWADNRSNDRWRDPVRHFHIEHHVDWSVADGVGLVLSAHKAPEITTWLAHRDRRRWHLHFTPTSSSWVNLVERWFKELTDRRLRRGTFTNVPELQDAITTWAGHWNNDPKPFVWKANAADIIEKVQRGRAALNHQTNSKTDH